MALRKCKQCGGQVDSTATACPHCGARKTNWVLVVILLISFISIFKSNFDNFREPNREAAPATDATPVKELAKTVVGESIQKLEKPAEKPVPKASAKKQAPEAQPEKWYIVYDYKKHICAEIPPPKDGVNVHPESLKKTLGKCHNSIYTNTNGKFWSFNCPEQGSVGTALYTSAKTFCETIVHLE